MYNADMKIVQAFPCRCRFADKENAPKVEEEVWILSTRILISGSPAKSGERVQRGNSPTGPPPDYFNYYLYLNSLLSRSARNEIHIHFCKHQPMSR